jgi:hypothetical protein
MGLKPQHQNSETVRPRRRKYPPNQTEKTMIRVTPKAVAYIAERGGNLTLYSKILAN